LIGTIFVIICVALIGIGGALDKPAADFEGNEDERIFNLIMALIFGILTGLAFAISAFNLQVVINSGFSVDQANFDGNCMLGLVFLGIYIGRMINDSSQYDVWDFLLANGAVTCMTAGVIFLGRSIACGYGGPTMAI
jgi:hypothetical protein